MIAVGRYASAKVGHDDVGLLGQRQLVRGRVVDLDPALEAILSGELWDEPHGWVGIDRMHSPRSCSNGE